ncbi:transmembrane protein 214 [Pectinophora gossypiella]|uniref:transmembrane protein 214 n=1 Tax=Pectinophora gossypiella TaxID=13191 RepID=UPI00214EAE7F|nr:transmembrane protein 214 [Pectinophora gossypiella]
MSTGQWEVVGKNKKSQNGKLKNAKDDDKKPTKNGPKLEDVVPHSQIKSFYSGMEIDDDRKPANKKKDGDKKKKEKKSEPPKPKPPKNLEEALVAIDPVELATIITTNKVRFSNAPLVWLKEVANFLNSKLLIDIEDPTFPHFPTTYPLSVVPSELRSSLENVLRDAGKANAQLFFDVTLTALANDMSRGQSVNGHRLLLQILTQDYPEFCVTSMQKSVNLRNSYQNRPPIGLSLLWAFGQGGLRDFAVGMKAWQELFVPVIELKNYSKYVVGYLSGLLDRHASMESVKITQEQLFSMIDLVNNKKNGLPKDLSSDLIKQLSKYKDIYFNRSGNKFQVTFNQLMKKLPNQYLSGASLDPYNQVLVECLLDCLQRDDSCNATWRQLFHKCSKQTATLLDYIDNNWEEVSPRLKQKSLKMTVAQYKESSADTLKGKKKDETVVRANKICQGILDRMTSTRRFPWLWASFFVLLAIGGLVAYDVSRAGGEFPKSVTGKLFKDLGILEHSQKAWQKTLSTSARGYLWLETNAPVYYNQTVEVCKPYGELSKDVYVIAVKKAGVLYGNVREYVSEKIPVVLATIEEYAPGLVDKVEYYACYGYTAFRKQVTDVFAVTADYLKTKVFIGEWAPEILQNKTQIALNATRDHMTTYFHWFRQQVHIYSEIP